ncbi:MAG TPA: response regulator [Myxococcota bacterium]
MAPPAGILIVEDEAIVAMDLQLTLQELGYDAYAVADSSDAAVRAATQRCPDLVLMDIRIKGERDGIETAGILRDGFAVPVVYLTSHADDRTIERAKHTAPYGYLQKPVRAAELRSAIEIGLYRFAMERRERERQRWFETTLKSIADAVIAVDLKGEVTFMNASAVALTGVTADVAVGRSVHDVLKLRDGHDDGGQPLVQALARREVVELKRGELHNQTTGATSVIADSASPVVDDSTMLGAVMVFRDITQTERLQQQLELADRLTSLGTLAAGVAHEVNNPLGAVVGNAQFVAGLLAAPAPLSTDDHVAAREAVADIESAGRRIARIVADLRTFSRPQQAHGDTVGIARCIEWVTRTTRAEVEQRATLLVRSASTAEVKADETRIGQVLVNLVINAMQAIPPGDPGGNVIELRSEDVGDDVVISVRDTGVGMSEQTQRRIFDPFFTTKDIGRGTGLGLSVCHGIVTTLGGRIDVDSAEGRGTTIRVTLPRAVVTPSPAPAATARATKALRVLAIDDDALVLRTVERVLQQHEVVCCARADEALALLERDDRFDVVLCDVSMPGVTGIDVYERVLAERPSLAARVLFMSGGAVSPITAHFLSLHAGRQIAKPFDVATLREAVAAMAAAATTADVERSVW